MSDRVPWSARARRLGADAIDVSPLVVVLIGMLVVIGSAQTPTAAWAAGMVSAFILFVLLSIWVVMGAIMLVRTGTTPGKRWLGLEVVRDDGSRLGYLTAFGREGAWKVGAVVLCGLAGIPGILVALACLIGPALVRADGRGLHDMALRTRVQDRPAADPA